VWLLSTVQPCIIHLIRNTFRLASRKDWDALKHDVKPIYTAVNAGAARAALDEHTEKWGPEVRRDHPALEQRVGGVSSRSWTTTWRSAPCCVPPTPSSR